MEGKQQSKLNAFASLKWYDSFIEFLFRFVAKTSEPLLALGIVISAVDFLTKGALLSHNPSLTEAWAWCQAIAIEASSGVVFVYALQSFKDRDSVKGRLYLALSVLLAFTGGAMLLLQLLATTASTSETTLPLGVFYALQSFKDRDSVKGRLYLALSVLLAFTGGAMLLLQLLATTASTSETALPLGVFYALAVLRVVVSVSYVYMCRAKHIRFTDLADVKEDASSTREDTLQVLSAQVQALTESVLQVTSTVTEVKTTVTQITAASLPVIETPLQIEAPARAEMTGVDGLVNDQSIYRKDSEQPFLLERFQSKEQVIAAILQRTPDARPEQVAQEARCSLRTAQKWMSRV